MRFEAETVERNPFPAARVRPRAPEFNPERRRITSLATGGDANFEAAPPAEAEAEAAADRQRAERLPAGVSERRRRLAHDLAAFNERIGGNADVAGAIGRPRSLVVAAVIEPSPLLGPLRQLLAVLGVLRWARAAQSQLQRTVVPLVVLLPPARGAAYVVARDGRLLRWSWTADHQAAQDGGSFRRQAGRWLGGVEQAMGRAWPLARETLAAASGPSDWTGRLLAALGGPLGLVVADAAAAPLAAAWAPLYPRLLLWRSGFDVASRRLVAWVDGRALQADTLAAGRLTAAASAQPERFRPGRETVQVFVDHLLPLLGLIVEPGETGPLDLLLTRFGRYGALPLRPRPRLTLVPPAVAAFVRAQGVAVDAGPAALRRARDRSLGRIVGLDPHAAVERLQAAVDHELAAWSDDMLAAVPELASALDRRRRGTRAALGRLEGELGERLRRRNRSLAQAWRQVQSLLYPLEGPQDETLATANLLAGTGPSPLERLVSAPAGRAAGGFFELG